MSDAVEISNLVLRFMLENNHVASRGLSPRQIYTELGLGESEYFSVDLFLLQSGYLEGGGGGPDGIRWLTPPGAQFIREELKKRIHIGLTAERVVRLLVHDVTDDESLTMDLIIKKLRINPKEYLDVILELEDLGFVEKESNISDEYPRLLPTKEGRLAFRKGFQAPVSVPLIHNGPIFNGPVTGSNIQTIASAINSEIQQNVSFLSSDELQEKIQQTLEELLGQIEDELSLQQKAAYTQMAAEFQKEITQIKPDAGKLRKLLAGLGLLSDLGGAIAFGQLTFDLVGKVSPYIMLLSQMVVQLLHNCDHISMSKGESYAKETHHPHPHLLPHPRGHAS